MINEEEGDQLLLQLLRAGKLMRLLFRVVALFLSELENALPQTFIAKHHCVTDYSYGMAGRVKNKTTYQDHCHIGGVVSVFLEVAIPTQCITIGISQYFA